MDRHEFATDSQARSVEGFLQEAVPWLRREFPPVGTEVEAAILDEIARLSIQHRAATLEWQKGLHVDPKLGGVSGQAGNAGARRGRPPSDARSCASSPPPGYRTSVPSRRKSSFSSSTRNSASRRGSRPSVGTPSPPPYSSE